MSSPGQGRWALGQPVETLGTSNDLTRFAVCFSGVVKACAGSCKNTFQLLLQSAYAGSVLTFQQSSNVAGSSHAISEIGGQTRVRPRFAEKRGKPVIRVSRTYYPNTLRLLRRDHNPMPREARTFTNSAAFSNPSSRV